jgi:hypothetical protein
MRSERGGLRELGVGLAGTAVLLAGLWCVPVSLGLVRAQQGAGGSRPPVDATTMEPPEPLASGDLMKGRMQQMQIAAVTERHKRMVADSDKLLQLATDLKTEVDKSTKDEMSVTAIKDAEDIEKLARQVKERMKGN